MRGRLLKWRLRGDDGGLRILGLAEELVGGPMPLLAGRAAVGVSAAARAGLERALGAALGAGRHCLIKADGDENQGVCDNSPDFIINLGITLTGIFIYIYIFLAILHVAS